MAQKKKNEKTAETAKAPANSPQLIAYHISERGEKTFWARIGAAWEHQDGEGFTLQLDLIPVSNDGRIILRSPGNAGDANDG